MTYDWKAEGARMQTQAAIRYRGLIKRSHDYYWLRYRALTGDVDYLDKDAGESPKGAQW
jgi:hypothetical protein